MSYTKFFAILFAIAISAFLAGAMGAYAYLLKTDKITYPINYEEEIKDAVVGGRIPGGDTVEYVKHDTLYRMQPYGYDSIQYFSQTCQIVCFHDGVSDTGVANFFCHDMGVMRWR